LKKRKYAVIVNPVAGWGKTMRLLPELREITETTGHRFDYYYTERMLHAAQIADRIYREYDAVVAFGGDGTANEVMNGLAGTATPFGIIPEGSGNDFARSIHVPKMLKKAVKILTDYHFRLMDVGTIEDRIFINGVGIGFDGLVNYRRKNTGIFRGSAAYLYAIFSSLKLWKAIPANVEIDGRKISDDPIYLVAIGNGWSVGGGLKLTPDAEIDDGAFNICHIRDLPIWKILLNFGKLKNGRISRVREVSMKLGRQILISSDQALPIHFDGEVFDPGAREVRISIVPQSAYVIGNWPA